MHLDPLLGCRIPVRHWIQTALEVKRISTFARRQENLWISGSSCTLRQSMHRGLLKNTHRNSYDFFTRMHEKLN